MSRFGQGWPGGSHEAVEGWFSPICKALKLTSCLHSLKAPDPKSTSQASLGKTVLQCRPPSCHV